jgi:hypothetical protein
MTANKIEAGESWTQHLTLPDTTQQDDSFDKFAEAIKRGIDPKHITVTIDSMGTFKHHTTTESGDLTYYIYDNKSDPEKNYRMIILVDKDENTCTIATMPEKK